MSGSTRAWTPFIVGASHEKPRKMRSVATAEGIRDRIRTAAFAEIQAREAFLWAAERFEDAPVELRDAWRELAGQEHRHLSWLLARLEALGGRADEQPVSARLWDALSRCATAREFAGLIAKAEERGRLAGETIAAAIVQVDPETARVFKAIAEEEIEHVELARRFYPEDASGPATD